MAELFVQPKKRTPWWLWLLLLLVILGITYYFWKGNHSTGNTTMVTDSTVTTTSTTTVKQPNWDKINFEAPAAKYSEVTDTSVKVTATDQYAIYSLGENILFAKNDSTIQSSAEARLKQIVASLNQRYKNASIGVFGRTDSTGTASLNKQLGAERAAAVKTWLISNGGIAENRVSVHSLGEAQPVATNSTPAGRQQNRSVQIVAIRDSSNTAQ